MDRSPIPVESQLSPIGEIGGTLEENRWCRLLELVRYVTLAANRAEGWWVVVEDGGQVRAP